MRAMPSEPPEENAPVPPEVAARNLAAIRDQNRRGEAAVFAYCAGVAPVIVVAMFGLPILLIFIANVAGALMAAWRASNHTMERAAYVVPALTFSLGVGVFCLRYLQEAGANSTLEVKELILPCVEGAIPGAVLWWMVTALIERQKRRR
jgi:hypothetical protein